MIRRFLGRVHDWTRPPRPLWPPPAATGRRHILLHAGLHKTGTTALQVFLAEAANHLLERAILYPATGRPDVAPHGQHNIAWQLAGDRRFQSRFGTVDELATEIACFSGNAVLSSEDFESVLGTPERLAPLLRHPALRDHTFTVMLYVRDQVSYLEALFIELLQHGMVAPARVVCDQVLAEGVLRHRAWAFHFDYIALLRRLWRVAGASVLVRAYEPGEKRSTVADFLSVAGLRPDASRGEAAQRIHARPGLAESLAAYCSYDSAPVFNGPRLCQFLNERRAYMSPRRRALFAARFDPGNRRLARIAGFPAAALGFSQTMPPDGLVLEHLFAHPSLRHPA